MGMMAAAAPKKTEFQPFMSGITYEIPTLEEIGQAPQVDYTASLQDIPGSITSSLFKEYIG
jgi:hypothetical protein